MIDKPFFIVTGQSNPTPGKENQTFEEAQLEYIKAVSAMLTEAEKERNQPNDQ